MKNGLNNLLLLFVCLNLSSCGHVRIKDQEYCSDGGIFGATCVTTLSEQRRDIPPEIWQHERVGMICSSADVYAENVATLLKLCKVSKRCTYDAKKKILKFQDFIIESQEALNE